MELIIISFKINLFSPWYSWIGAKQQSLIHSLTWKQYQAFLLLGESNKINIEFIDTIHICIAVRDPISKGVWEKSWDPTNPVLHFCGCPKSGPGFVTLYVVIFFMFNCFEVRGGCTFCWYWWNCWPSLLKLSFAY